MSISPALPVSRETEKILRHYGDMLLEWNRAINLIAPSTTSEVWERHILDGLQLTSWIPNDTQRIVDMGSGGGLPVVPLAVERTEILFFAIESDKRKVAFLRHVQAILSIQNLRILEQRLEETTLENVDIVTARACAPIENLVAYSTKLRHKDSRCLFLKGKQYQEEITAAQQKWDFTVQLHPSITQKEARIVELTNIRLQQERP